MLSTVVLHAFAIARYFDLFTNTGRGHWNVFVKNFTVSGFDPITYSVVTHWDANYNVYRHPLLSFMVWPLSELDKWLMAATGVNLVQFIVAVPLLLCAFYTFIFMYRTLRDIVRLRAFDSALLSTMLFSFAYVMVSSVVPDHFCVSMFLLVFAVYVSGRKMQDGMPFKIWQTVVLFFVTAGVTLSNGVKIYIYSLFTNGRKFFRLKYFLFAVLLPPALIWGFARWEYRQFVLPKEKARSELRAKKNAENRQRMFKAFCDTTRLKDSVEVKRLSSRRCAGVPMPSMCATTGSRGTSTRASLWLKASSCSGPTPRHRAPRRPLKTFSASPYSFTKTTCLATLCAAVR